jgi:ketosteroid isomerase-like protein
MILSLMKNAALAITMAFALIAAAPAQAADQDDIKAVIESQLNAFAADDGMAAYSHAAPIVKQVFPTVDQFMAMVKQGYQPVYRNTNRVYSDIFPDRLGRPAMRVVLTGQNGKRYEALYAMEKQADGSWKIASCMILEIPSQEV